MRAALALGCLALGGCGGSSPARIVVEGGPAKAIAEGVSLRVRAHLDPAPAEVYSLAAQVDLPGGLAGNVHVTLRRYPDARRRRGL